MSMGPNTGPGRTSVLSYTEAQINFIIQSIRNIFKNDLNFISVKKEVQDDYNRRTQKRMKHTVWTSRSCNSWHLNKDGNDHALYPGFAIQYASGIRHFKSNEFTAVKNAVADKPELKEAVSA